MQWDDAAIGDEAARCFSAAFYETLASKNSVKMAFDLGRNAVVLRGLTEDTKPQLYVRKGVSANAILAVSANDDAADTGSATLPGFQSVSASKESPTHPRKHVWRSPAAVAGYLAIIAALIFDRSRCRQFCLIQAR